MGWRTAFLYARARLRRRPKIRAPERHEDRAGKVSGVQGVKKTKPRTNRGFVAIGGCRLFRRRRFLLEEGDEIVPQLDLGALALHDDALLDDRQRVVPGPVDDQAGREG